MLLCSVKSLSQRNVGKFVRSRNHERLKTENLPNGIDVLSAEGEGYSLASLSDSGIQPSGFPAREDVRFSENGDP